MQFSSFYPIIQLFGISIHELSFNFKFCRVVGHHNAYLKILILFSLLFLYNNVIIKYPNLSIYDKNYDVFFNMCYDVYYHCLKFQLNTPSMYGEIKNTNCIGII